MNSGLCHLEVPVLLVGITGKAGSLKTWRCEVGQALSGRGREGQSHSP